MSGFGPYVGMSVRGLLALVALLGLAVSGCGDEAPAADEAAGGGEPGLEEGAIVDRTVYTYRSTSAFDPPEVRQVPHQVVDGKLVPLDEVGGESPPLGDIEVAYYDPQPRRAREITPTEHGSEEVVQELMDLDDVRMGPQALEFLQSAPAGARATTRTEILTAERLAAVDYLSELGTHGIEFQFRQVEPPPTGATEVVEVILDGKTRGAIEQFDDPTALTSWYKANVQMMQDLGMDPDEHMVLRGLTLVRVGKTGHAAAIQRARETPLVDERLGYLTDARRAADAAEAQASFDPGARAPEEDFFRDGEITLVPLDEIGIEITPVDQTVSEGAADLP